MKTRTLAIEELSLRLSHSVAIATRFLFWQVGKEAYFLKCLASDGTHCPIKIAGHLVGAFFISQAIGDILPARQREIILRRIERERQGSVWGYSKGSPSDADDTAFALRTALKLGQESDPGALDLFFHDKAYTTFEQGPVRQPTTLVHDISIKNNFGTHPEVLANVYNFLADSGERDKLNLGLLQKVQAVEGFVHSYFYPSKYYGTWMFMELLWKFPGFEKEKSLTLKFLTLSQNQDGSWGSPGNAYETALALNSYRRESLAESEIKKAVWFLLEVQETDGSWAADKPIWECLVSEEPLRYWSAYDEKRVITTSLAVTALTKLGCVGSHAMEIIDELQTADKSIE